MLIVIMGCGRVGSTLARALERHGETVSVIDVDVEAFRRLGPEFQGRTVKGVGFDRNVLLKSGIREADGFAALSNGDNSNILAARVVREEFGVENVVARIYDSGRAEIYEKLGIPTVATVRWAAVQAMSHLLPMVAEPVWRDPSGQTIIAQMPYNDAWVGLTITAVEHLTHTRVVTMLRLGQGIVPDATAVVQDGDVLYLSMSVAKLPEIRATMAALPDRS
ncbi:MAG: TrkA family potassium uptake protein [Propionibacteriaceae bacterium]|nr:TrkA family potassium uptake protein [Propionibacteriaceae bacterium]